VEHQPRDLHGVLDLHVKLGVATYVHPTLEDVAFLKQDQVQCLLHGLGESGIWILQLQFDQRKAV